MTRLEEYLQYRKRERENEMKQYLATGLDKWDRNPVVQCYKNYDKEGANDGGNEEKD